jgi:predicted nucleic-acid-binding protein
MAKIIADTNVLMRMAVGDDAAQEQAAAAALRGAELIAVSTHALCEFVWVLRQRYKFAPGAIAASIRDLLDAPNVAADRPKIEAGLRMLDAGGDFADGVIAYEGQWLGGETFVSFDKRAVDLLDEHGQFAVLLVAGT